MYIQGGYKEDWATLHAYVFIVIDCIEICRTLFEKQKVLHASRYSIFLCVSRSLFLLYFHRVVYFISPSLSLSLFLPLFLSLSHSLTRSLARSLSNTTNRSKRFTRYNHVFHIYHAVAYNKIRHRLQQQQHTLTRTAQTHVFFFIIIIIFFFFFFHSSSIPFTREL